MAKGRPPGANAKYTAAKTCIDKQFELLKWSNKHIKNAQKVIVELMEDTNTQASVRKGCANTIIELHQKFAKTYGKGEIRPEDFIEKKREQKPVVKDEGNGLVSYTMEDVEDTGTEG